MKEAKLWNKLDKGRVKCNLCGHRCTLHEGRFGICGARKNEKGVLYSASYGHLIATNVDPIEKKPLFHFYPGSRSFSLASAGCNFKCQFCQNYSISQLRNEELIKRSEEATPEQVVDTANKQGCKSMSYTYTEPTVNFEFVYECSELAKKRNIFNTWVTNGFMTDEAIEMISPYIDAANIDLKAFKEETYKNVMGGKLEVVLNSIKKMKEKGIWVEITTLIVPDMNDSDEELSKLAQFIASVDPLIPWHVSRYHADYKYATRRDKTPVKTIEKASDIGSKAGLKYIYCGNIWGAEGEHTFCHGCNEKLIERYGFTILSNKIVNGKCSKCSSEIPGKWR